MPLKRKLDDPVTSLFGKRGSHVPQSDEVCIEAYQFQQFINRLPSQPRADPPADRHADPPADPPADPTWYKRMLVENRIPLCAPFMKDKQCSDRYLL